MCLAYIGPVTRRHTREASKSSGCLVSLGLRDIAVVSALSGALTVEGDYSPCRE